MTDEPPFDPTHEAPDRTSADAFADAPDEAAMNAAADAPPLHDASPATYESEAADAYEAPHAPYTSYGRSTPPRVRGAWRWAGAVAAAATAGALVAFGLRDDGNVFAVFTAAGRLALGIAPTEGAAKTTLACAAGLVMHVLLCALWGALFALLAARRRPLHLAITAALLATAVYSAARLWLPDVLQLGYALRATRPQLVVLYTLLAGGLWSGTRLAQLASRDA